MKYWKEENTEAGYGDKGFVLRTGEGGGIISITKSENGMIRFLEECDGYFGIELTKEEAIEALQEAINIIAT